MSFPRWNAASGPVISGPGCIFSLFLAPVVVRLQYPAAALWYSECSFVAARLRAHMHLKGRSLDRLLMLRPFTSLPLCPRENFNPPQMQTASPWKLLWKLPQQQNARRPQTFPFFWTFFCFDLRGFWRTPALSVLLGVCGESIYLWFCRSERWRGGKMMRGLRFINRKLPTVGGCSGWGAQRWLSSLAALFILLKSAAQKKTKRFFSIQVSQPAHEKNPQTQRISFVSWRSVGIWPPFCRDDNAAIREENWLNPPPTLYFWLSAAVSTGKKNFLNPARARKVTFYWLNCGENTFFPSSNALGLFIHTVLQWPHFLSMSSVSSQGILMLKFLLYSFLESLKHPLVT